MKHIKIGLCSILLLVSTTILAAPSFQMLDQLLSSFKSMSASFQQTAIVKNSPAKKSTGSMALERPGKFRWEIKSPNRQMIIADGKNLWIYDVDLEQAIKRSLTKDTHSPAILLSGSTTALEERFSIIDSTSQGDKTTFLLKPKQDQDMIQKVELVFISKKLSQMSVMDNLGQKNVFYFSDVKINPALSASLFQFNPPKGIDIVKE